MDTSLIFVIIIMFYFCIIFPLQMRRYIQKRHQRLQSQRYQTRNNASSHMRNVTYQNNSGLPAEQPDSHFIFGVSTTSGTESRRDDEIAAARHLEAEHRQQIIEIQREVEEQAVRRREENLLDCLNGPHMPSRLANSSAIRDQVTDHSQQIIDMQREIEQHASRGQDDVRPHSNAPHIPSRLINSSTIRSSIYTITSGGAIGASNPHVHYPHAPPMTPDDEGLRHIRFPNRSNSKDDELPSYDQAVAYDSTTTSVTIRRF